MAVRSVLSNLILHPKYSYSNLSRCSFSVLVCAQRTNTNFELVNKRGEGVTLKNVNDPHQLFIKTTGHVRGPLSHHGQKRFYSDDNQKKITLPRLMDFPQVAWPNIFKSIKNWILASFVITPYFDREFNIEDFIIGSKKAVECVSHCLANGDYDNLKGLVEPDAIEEIKKTISTFSVQQRTDLAVNQDDIYFSFPYEVGVMFDDKKISDKQIRFVEITMCYHVLRGMKEMQGKDEKPGMNFGMNSELQDKVFILNYRFIRDFTKGVTDDWTVNIVNHYRPSDYV